MKKVTCTRCSARFEAGSGKCPACGARERGSRVAPKTGRAARSAKSAKQEKRAVAAGFIVAALAVLAVLTVILCSLGGVFDFVGSSAPKMPDVVGQTEANARQMLEGLDLRVEVKTEQSAEAVGVVIKQSVPAERALRANQVVTLTVSDGSLAERVDTGDEPEETVEAPFVQGEDFEAARARAEAQGLYLTFGGEEYSDAPEGTILAQDPMAGTRIRPGSAIRVTVSLGPEIVEYEISVSAGKGGSVSPSGRVTVEEGEDAVFTITADEGYVLDELFIDDERVRPVEEFTFAKVDADHTLYAVFRVKTEADGDGETETGKEDDERPAVSTPSDIKADR